jgi:hypothetical protein
MLSLAPVWQSVAAVRIQDVASTVTAGLRALHLEDRVQPGMRIAIGVGSRGISCLPEVVQVLVTALLALDAKPFLVPAMGSHGGGTAAGQRLILEDFGLAQLGASIESSLDTVLVGHTPAGMPVYFDANAGRADGIIVINRIKEHTAFKARWESGLLKMLAVGLGKTQGAAAIHNWGLAAAIPEAARLIIQRLPVIAGIGIVENGNHEPAQVVVLPADRIESEEPQLLDNARWLTPKIPFDPLDLLIVREMGKNISGTGMDLNVIGMWRRVGGPIEPQIGRVVVLDLTAKSRGNGIGVGHADLITQRLRDKIDLAVTYTNCLTSHNLPGAKIPLTLPSDREAIAAGLAGIPPERLRAVLIQNTLSLDLLWVTPALLPHLSSVPGLQQAGPDRPLEFDSAGNLVAPVLA